MLEEETEQPGSFAVASANSSLPNMPDDLDLTKFIEVKIVDQEKYAEDYMLFLIETRVSAVAGDVVTQLLGGGPLLTAGRRYSDFDQLRRFLESKYPWCLVPPLPDKLSSYAPWKIANQKFDPEFLEMRRFGLDKFIQRLLAHPKLGREEAVIFFLREDDYWQVGCELLLLSDFFFFFCGFYLQVYCLSLCSFSCTSG